MLADHLGATPYEVYETTGEENVADVVRDAVRRGVGLVMAVGGDGTIAEVAAGLVGTDVPLAVIPVGTGNFFATAVGLPLSPRSALEQLRDSTRTTTVDLIKVGERYFHGNVGVGLTSRVMEDIEAEAKRRVGILAYLWVALKKLLGHQPYRFMLEIDGQRRRYGASELLLINHSSVGGLPGIKLGRDVRMDDGRMDLYIARARNILDYLIAVVSLISGRERQARHLSYHPVRDHLWIETEEPAPVQADGEFIGTTPVRVEMVPAALNVVLPRQPSR
jgi:YegS/Rv2252/BmrU family lipid kinase